MIVASETQGRAAAGTNLPDYPEDCRRKEAHAPLVEGQEKLSILKREREALDRQNARTDRCADFYDDVKRGLE
ncbi:hypothetical protein F9L00_03405 [Brucella anthropi]|nr:hypothetical protein [Brucella anthropi]KAB2765504.1 hypothetical protein F9K98_01260 [Brucella anthropi]KAB2782845.1 hypothetical protein F9L00_03405 [Brucella anthropi]MCQ9143346.1 hypothetical protein [Ochrobactrum sp. BTU2]UGQ24289.1 hypothetical protein LRL11_16625 [Brucella anthropi]